MSVIRVNKTKDYSTMSNYHLKDKNLSLKAKGLLSVMLSLPENWDYSIKGLVAISKENETSINSALKELKENGYLIVDKKMPNETKSGRIEYEYNVYEKPKQESKKQDLENLGVESLGVENIDIDLYNNNITNNINNNKLNTNNKILKKELNNDVYKSNDLISKEKEDKEKETVDLFSIEKEEKCSIAEPKEEIPYKKIIDYLNEKIGTNYQHTSRKTRDLIKARWNDGFRLNDFYTVIDKKVIEWYNDNKMKMYLRPETLFSNKFESYLNQLDKTLTTKDFAGQLDFSRFMGGNK